MDSMQNPHKIIHIDMDAFYASVEQLDSPSLRGKPVIVGGNPGMRGVVAACSYEARKYGVHSAMPCSKAYQLCPQAVFIRPRLPRYKEVSNYIMDIFKQYTHLVEPLSLDEAFLDVTVNKKNNPSATLLADCIRKQIYKETGLTASSGVSFNKFLAKVASDLNKPNGSSIILPEQAHDFLSQLPIGDFFGVGKVTKQKMLAMGISNGKTLREYSKSDLIHHFGKSGVFFYNIVRGIDNRPIKPSRIRKSIGAETTFQKDTKDISLIQNILEQLSTKVEESLKKKQCWASTLTLKIRYHDFTTITRSITLKSPIYSKGEILNHLPQLLKKTEVGRRRVRLLGVTMSKLTTIHVSSPRQLLLPFIKNQENTVFFEVTGCTNVNFYLK